MLDVITIYRIGLITSLCVISTSSIAAESSPHLLSDAESVRQHRSKKQGKTYSSQSQPNKKYSSSHNDEAVGLIAFLSFLGVIQNEEDDLGPVHNDPNNSFADIFGTSSTGKNPYPGVLLPDNIENFEEQWKNRNIQIGIEYSWLNLGVSNGSDGGLTPGSTFRSNYDLDTVESLEVNGSMRFQRFAIEGVYGESPAGRELAQHVYGAIRQVDADNSFKWELSYRQARIQGTATSKDAGGTVLKEAIDTKWLQWRIIRHFNNNFSIGGMYHELSIPSIYSFNDPDGPVLTFFDPSTKFRSLSLFLGYDRNAMFKEKFYRALSWDVRTQIHFGLGSLSYNKESRRVVESFGYGVSNDNIFIELGARLHLGATHWRHSDTMFYQFNAGLLMEFIYIGNEYNPQEGDSYDTLHLDYQLGVTGIGPYIGTYIRW